MELGEKLQELRKKKGLTQEELAQSLCVSRTAISKWESGRGYPSVDSIKDIAKFFGITIDELLSSNQLLSLAEADNKQTKKFFRDLVYGLLDISVGLLFFLPFFAQKIDGLIQSVSLINLNGVQQYLKIVYYVIVLAIMLMGILTLALQNCNNYIWLKSKTLISLILGVLIVGLFIISLQPYVAVFSFVLLIIKTIMIIKWR